MTSGGLSNGGWILGQNSLPLDAPTSPPEEKVWLSEPITRARSEAPQPASSFRRAICTASGARLRHAPSSLLPQNQFWISYNGEYVPGRRDLPASPSLGILTLTCPQTGTSVPPGPVRTGAPARTSCSPTSASAWMASRAGTVRQVRTTGAPGGAAEHGLGGGWPP